jgi:hypothetical protein
MIKHTNRAIPTPTPACAPVDNPVLGPISTIPLAPVIIADGALVPLAQNRPVPELVHVAPLPQHPPPMEEGQLNCPAAQPLGTIETRVVGGTDVEMHALVVHWKPRLQHPPPYELAH